MKSLLQKLIFQDRLLQHKGSGCTTQRKEGQHWHCWLSIGSRHTGFALHCTATTQCQEKAKLLSGHTDINNFVYDI